MRLEHGTGQMRAIIPGHVCTVYVESSSTQHIRCHPWLAIKGGAQKYIDTVLRDARRKNQSIHASSINPELEGRKNYC